MRRDEKRGASKHCSAPVTMTMTRPKINNFDGENDAVEDKRIKGMNLIKAQERTRVMKSAKEPVNNRIRAENDRTFISQITDKSVTEHLLHHSFYYCCGF